MPASDFNQGGLAGAVLAEQRVDLAAPDVEIDAIKRQRPGKLLDDTAQLQEGVIASRLRADIQGATPQIWR